MKRWTTYLIPAGLIILLSTSFLTCSMSTPVTGISPEESVSIAVPSESGENTIHWKVNLANKQADGYVIPLEQVKIVCIITDVGMIGCGAFDVIALDSFGIPAAKMKSTNGNPIATIDDLMNAVVKEANNEAAKLGINVGMSGRETLDLL